VNGKTQELSTIITHLVNWDGLRAGESQHHPLVSVAVIQGLFSEDIPYVLIHQQEPFAFIVRNNLVPFLFFIQK